MADHAVEEDDDADIEEKGVFSSTGEGELLGMSFTPALINQSMTLGTAHSTTVNVY